MKKGLGIILAIFIAFTSCVKLSAEEASATFAYSSSTNVEVGENFKVNVVIKNVVGNPIAGAVAKVNYDSEFLEFVECETNYEAPFQVYLYSKSMKFSGISLTGEGIEDEAEMLTLTFKAIKEGNTTLSFDDLDLADINAETIDGKSEDMTFIINSVNEEVQEEIMVEEKAFEVENVVKVVDKIEETYGENSEIENCIEEMGIENSKIVNNIEESTIENLEMINNIMNFMTKVIDFIKRIFIK